MILFYFPDCPFPFSVLKHAYLNAVPNKTSVKIIWKYDPDPEDTGILIGVDGVSEKLFNFTVREYVVHGLGKSFL